MNTVEKVKVLVTLKTKHGRIFKVGEVLTEPFPQAILPEIALNKSKPSRRTIEFLTSVPVMEVPKGGGKKEETKKAEPVVLSKKDKEFVNKWIRMPADTFNGFVSENVEKFVDASEAVIERAKKKWDKYYPETPWNLEVLLTTKNDSVGGAEEVEKNSAIENPPPGGDLTNPGNETVNKVECVICNEVFDTTTDLEKHVKEVHTTGK